MAHIKTLHSHVALNIITGLSEQMPFTSRIQQKRPAEKQQVLHGAENGTQTREPPAWKASALSTELFPRDFLEIG